MEQNRACKAAKEASAQALGAQAFLTGLTSTTMAGTVPPEVSQGALSQKQNPGLAEAWGNPVVAFLLFLHSSRFDNEMIVWILQEVIISMGTEPVLAQGPRLARAKTSEVTAKLPILENL